MKCWMVEYSDMPYSVTYQFNYIDGSDDIERDYDFADPDYPIKSVIKTGHQEKWAGFLYTKLLNGTQYVQYLNQT